MFDQLSKTELDNLGDRFLNALSTATNAEFGCELASLTEDVLVAKFRLGQKPVIVA